MEWLIVRSLFVRNQPQHKRRHRRSNRTIFIALRVVHLRREPLPAILREPRFPPPSPPSRPPSPRPSFPSFSISFISVFIFVPHRLSSLRRNPWGAGLREFLAFPSLDLPASSEFLSRAVPVSARYQNGKSLFLNSGLTIFIHCRVYDVQRV